MASLSGAVNIKKYIEFQKKSLNTSNNDKLINDTMN
jgi:hypothetical protein